MLLNAQPFGLPQRKDMENPLYLEIVKTKNLCAKKFNFDRKAIETSFLLDIGKERNSYARSELKLLWEKDQLYIGDLHFKKLPSSLQKSEISW